MEEVKGEEHGRNVAPSWVGPLCLLLFVECDIVAKVIYRFAIFVQKLLRGT